MFISCSRSFNFPPLFLNGSKLEKVSHFKYLGVWISDDLSKHIESICSKFYRTIAIYLEPFTPEAVLSLYKFQVLPVLEYACVVWDLHLRKTNFSSNLSNYLPPYCHLEIGLLTVILAAAIGASSFCFSIKKKKREKKKVSILCKPVTCTSETCLGSE